MEKVNIGNDTIYLKKDWLGYRVVEPIVLKNPETNKVDWKTWNWKNFLNKKGFITLFIILLILGVGYLGFKEQVNNYRKVMDNPCSYCKDCQTQTIDFINKYGDKYKINLSVLEYIKQ